MTIPFEKLPSRGSTMSKSGNLRAVAILHAIRGLGGTVLKTSVDLERVQPIQSKLAARNE
jgi:hypothetical protein